MGIIGLLRDLNIAIFPSEHDTPMSFMADGQSNMHPHNFAVEELRDFEIKSDSSLLEGLADDIRIEKSGSFEGNIVDVEGHMSDLVRQDRTKVLEPRGRVHLRLGAMIREFEITRLVEDGQAFHPCL